MPKLTVELPDKAYNRLRTNAQHHGRSVEEEARAVVLDRFPDSDLEESREDLLERIRQRRNAMPAVIASPEEVKQWINFGRP